MMALGTIERQNSQYRRGLVLGFTLAEIITLIIFCLLLALTARLLKEKRQIDILATENAQQAAELNLLQARLEEYKKTFRNPSQIDDLFKELVLLRREAQQVAMLQTQVASLSEKAQQWDLIQKAIADGLPPDASPQQAVERLMQDAQLAAAIRDAMEAAGLDPSLSEIREIAETLKQSVQEAVEANPGLSPSESIKQAVSSRDSLIAKVSDLQGQNKNLRDKLERIGPGLEMPPCWANRESGKPEYIFDVALTSTGFIVRDRTPPHRMTQRTELPVNMTFDQEITSTQFLAEAYPLYQWSVQSQCRFFVRAFDQTGSGEKREYKLMMRRLETRFYKLEVLNESF